MPADKDRGALPLVHPARDLSLGPERRGGARVLAISSWVASGHVGLAAIVPALQRLGHDVVALPTVLLSCHPGHATFAGERVAPELLQRMADVLLAGDGARAFDAVLTGYLPTPAHVEVAERVLDRVRLAGDAPYLCDPVVGDHPKGLYVDRAAAEAIRDRLVPRADILTPNLFELAWLAGPAAGPMPTSLGEVRALGRAVGAPAVLVTSVPVHEQPGLVGNLLELGPRERHRHGSALRSPRAAGALLATVARHQEVPHGTGDLLSGLFLGHLLRGRSEEEALGRTVAGLEIAVADSLGAPDLQLVRSAERWAGAAPVSVASLGPGAA